jgi:hypothetical protein
MRISVWQSSPPPKRQRDRDPRLVDTLVRTGYEIWLYQ